MLADDMACDPRNPHDHRYNYDDYLIATVVNLHVISIHINMLVDIVEDCRCV